MRSKMNLPLILALFLAWSWNSSGMAVPSTINDDYELASCNAGLSIQHTYCDLSSGSLTANAIGEPSFTYLWSNGATTQTISNLSAGTYTVTITGSLGCVSILSGTIMHFDELFTSIDFQGSFCFQGYAYLQAYTNSGAPPYTYLWNTGETTDEIYITDPGEYCVTVVDSHGCSGSDCFTIGYVGIDFNIEHTTCQYNNGKATVYITNGAEYGATFKWSNGATTKTIIGLAPGDYTVTVTDKYGCSEPGTITIESSEPLEIALETTHTSCGLDNGSIYAYGVEEDFLGYQWSNGEITQTISNLAPGLYLVTATNTLGCSAEQSVFIEASTGLSLTKTVIPTSCGVENGSISINTEDDADYIFEWSTGQTTQTIQDLAPGIYTVTVTNDKGCFSILTSTVDSSSQIILTEDVTHTSCGLDYGIATVLPSGGHGFSFLWSTGDTTQTISALPAGTYTVTVSANGGCSTIWTSTVDSSDIDITITNEVSHTSCGTDNGSITAIAEGGSFFIYAWSTGDSTQTITDLAPGSYTVTVSAIGGCSATQTALVNDSEDISILADINPTTCGGNNGSIAIASFGGDSFEYLWENGQTTAAISGLKAGDYSVTVTNNLGCSTSIISHVEASKTLKVSTLIFEPSCEDCQDASITAIADGTAPYVYQWSTGETTQSIENLSLGIYFVTVTDDLGCTVEDVIIINDPNCLPISLEIDATDAPCHLENGTVSVLASGGTAPLTYAWSSGDTSEEASVPAGTYYVIVTDSLGCLAYGSVSIQQPAPIRTQISIVDEQCFGDENGSIHIDVDGGFEPFSFEWSNGATEASLDDLAPGYYTATITDANGCTTTIAAAITEAPALFVPIQGDTTICYGAIGTLTVDGAFDQYLWSSGDSTNTIFWDASGVYTVTVTNESGCSASTSITTVTNDEIFSEIEQQDSGLTVSVQGGTAPYTYIWSSGETTASIDPQDPGTYIVTITDALGCTSTATYDFTVSTQDELSDLSVILYPNPVKNMLEIELQKVTSETTIAMYDMHGKLILQQKDHGSTYVKIDLTAFASGAYFLHVYNKTGSYRTQVIKM
ncbi:MAG: T9SS type A sorting domain-containing protein [Chitinophagales bacterium]|nr:T9SS type A sorting domain-containing protein [Chitinophagales bacterium]